MTSAASGKLFKADLLSLQNDSVCAVEKKETKRVAKRSRFFFKRINLLFNN